MALAEVGLSLDPEGRKKGSHAGELNYNKKIIRCRQKSHSTRASGAVGVGLSLVPEGRKRLRGSSFALKSRERSFLDFQLLLIFFNLNSHFLDNFFFNFLNLRLEER